MTHSIGIDIVDVVRIRKAIDRFGNRFIDKILGPIERERLTERRDRAAFVAGRFAAKEALIKAFGRYLVDRPPFTHLQIVNDSTGRPELLLPEYLASKLRRLDIQISISHEKNHAVATALCWETT